ncbi:MAG: glycoside hydrolase N-terminal domain-containing protein [Clostridia bacterium]|nr:glycoside hydrolase N-terminal domain-containing protein [Clostridia bacterium]
MGIVFKILGIIITVFQMIESVFVPVETYDWASELFSDPSKASYSELCYELSQNSKNVTDTWRQGMISGNGLQGVITSGSPYSDTLIYQNMHFIMPNKNVRYCPDTSHELETVKQNIAASKNITDNASYDDVYAFHPGASLRIEQTKRSKVKYIRYTDYETAQVGVQYTNIKGTWNRTTFTSQADGVTITKIGSSSTGSKVNLTLSIDDISTFANYGNGSEVDIKYKKLTGDDGEYIAMVAHYPDYENSELKEGGYATVVYIINEGGIKRNSRFLCNVKDVQYCGEKDPTVKISGADNVYLIAVTGRTYEMGKMEDFAAADSYALVDELLSETKAVAEKYTCDGLFDYEAALKAHSEIFKAEFDKVTLKLGDNDSTKANEGLVLDQYRKDKINTDLAERAYYSGRYAYLCAGGSSTPRLYGMWTGEWAPGWGSKYTMDANVNLQTSSMNTGNMESSYIGYASFILRQVPDWEENARATHGFSDAIQAPVNSDGDKAVITETCYPYPFRYWNAGTSWMLQPLYETLLCYGDVKIPITEEFDMNSLKSVLSLTAEDLTDEEISAMSEKGWLDLRSQILLPLLLKSANYWDQMMTPEYFTDSTGNVHYQKGKTELNEGETYAILPSYSPENNPSNYPSPSVANAAIDISACKSNLEMLIDIIKSLDSSADTAHWQSLLEDLPVYLYDETGAIKEWAASEFEENNLHRHLSHLYCVWPMFETQNDEQLKAACVQAIANRASENQSSHALVHRALIAARLKDSAAVTDSLVNLMNHWIYYDSLMTNHDYDRNSCYCTDFAIGYLGIINESLVYSYTGEIEVLSALPDSGFDSGEIKGIRTRSRAVVDSLKWNIKDGTAEITVTSDIDQVIEVSCALSDETHNISFTKGETKTVTFNITK